MKILSDILDRLLTAPGETPGEALTRRSDPPAAASSVAEKPVRTPRSQLRSKAVPATAYLLLDVSSSMDERKLRQAQDGGVAFAADAIGKGYRVGVIQFSSWARLRTEPTKRLGVIRAGLEQAVFQLTTNMASAIELGATQLGGIGGLRAVVLVTDGYPDDAEAALRAAMKAKACGITIIAIGTHDADEDFLKKLATASGLATTVPDSELQVAITSAARLLPSRTSGSK